MRRTLFLLVLAGCAEPASAPSPKTEARIAVEAESPEWAKIAEEAAKGLSVADQQRLVESEQRYQLALAWFNKGDFDKAKSEAQRAVQLWPDHLAARKLLDDVNEIIVGGPVRLRGIGDRELQVAKVTVEQSRLEIENHLLHGRRYLDAKMYASAIREFENAEFKIRNQPHDGKAMNDLLPGLRELKPRASSSLSD
jgi:tetratricopeptide (TPR) repeat protein